MINYFHQRNLDIDLIAGVTRNEGGLSVSPKTKVTLEGIKVQIENTFKGQGVEPPKNITEFYLRNRVLNNSESLRKAIQEFDGDSGLICQTYFFAKQYSELNPKSNVYFYELTYQSIPFNGACDKTMGVCHATDLIYVFGHPILNPNSRPQIEYDFSQEVITFWTNFAKTGYK